MAFLDAFKFGKGPWDPSHRYETSWLLPPWLLFACRALFSLYAFVDLFFTLGWTCTHASAGGCQTARRTFSYFTVLTYWGIAFYFAVSATHTLTYILSRGRSSLLARLPRPLQALHALYYTSVTTLPFLVTVVAWTLLFTGRWFPETYDAWSNVSQHALNSAFALFELVFARAAPPPWVHVLGLILILLGYLAVAFITVADQGWYTYRFLDHDKVGGRGFVAAYILGIAVGIIVIFALVWGLIHLRVWVTEKKLGMEGKFVAETNTAEETDLERGTTQETKEQERKG
ncbi:FAR-17a/AIG1-like protein [Cordyceps fumosorosea ARSEF 2679]|uniref:FAR-17a/AIG1-like protein n=1 Tax=Cordyceps fumosorosea (strain ARSEF 2679) TaxID=1081104 RepID=A0A167V6D8_CORFA|nr:FAR-17a/AIG1-like protein [Cordyceps fumosorosea ARSEF 2679]OAA62275.1 FAR-17a/AIG1-like protein [Cordyceps fumosorosea ARSEF 2679]